MLTEEKKMKKITLIPVGAIILIIAIVALCGMMNVKDEVKPAETSENEPTSDNIETVPEEPSEKEEMPTEPSTEATEPSESESVYTTPSEQQIIPEPVQKETAPAAPPKEPQQEEPQCETVTQESVGIVIGTPEPEPIYSCGTPLHRCSGPEAHAFVCELEQKGCGDGANGTCVQYVNACNCPNCGEQVPAWTCHYCG